MRLSILTRIVLFLFVPLAAVAAKDDFSTYLAQNRPAEELVQAAEKLVNNVRIHHMNGKIVIYGSDAGRAAAMNLFRELDSAARMYRIHVRAVAKGTQEREAKAIEGGIGNDTVSVGKRKSGVLRGGGGTVSVGGVAATAESQARETSNQGGQTVTLIDGGTATIAEGAGFFPTAVNVTLRSRGEKGAHLKLRHQAARGARVQNLSTEIDLKLGVWRTIGGLKRQDSGKDSEILGSATRESASDRDVQVMVELDK